jgi:DNA-binding LacI/PurR family transcriptional regulator
VRSLLQGPGPPDAIFATSYFRLFPFLWLLNELGLRHPHDVLLAGFDEPVETWEAEIVRNVIEEPLLVVHQDAAEMGRIGVDLALSAVEEANVSKQQHPIRPILSWEHEN